MIPVSDTEALELNSIRDEIWVYYHQLKHFKEAPHTKFAKRLRQKFYEIFNQEMISSQVECELKKLYSKKERLLIVLKRPEIPLHNNAVETDIREYVTRRKISGGT